MPEILNHLNITDNMKKLAIIGAGPAGITAAHILAQQGYEVVIYEKDEPLTHLTDKAYLFPNFAEADTLAESLRHQMEDPHIDLRGNTTVDNIIPPSEADARWQVSGEYYNAVILASGYTPFDAHRKEELGYGIYPGVHTSLELEQMLKRGRVVNNMGDVPKSIVLLHCVGSRDEKIGNQYCSKLCCVTAVKQAIEIKKCSPSTDLHLFYMDLRMWGEGFEELYRTAQELYGIHFVRGRISEASGTFDGRVQIKAEDTLMGLPMRMTTDMLVLMVGMEASAGTRKLATQCGICGEYGYARSRSPHLDDNLTAVEGLYLCGTCKRPMTLTDTIADATTAAWKVIEKMSER